MSIHAYIRDLRTELKASRSQRDYLLRVIEEQELVIARLQHDRDCAEEIVMALADAEPPEPAVLVPLPPEYDRTGDGIRGRMEEMVPVRNPQPRGPEESPPTAIVV